MSISQYVESEAAFNRARDLGRSPGEAAELVFCYNYNRMPLDDNIFITGCMIQFNALRMIPSTGVTKARSIASSVADGLKHGKDLMEYGPLEIQIFQAFQAEEPDKALIGKLGVKAS